MPAGTVPSTSVVDHVEGDIALLLRDPRDGNDLGRVHDRRVEACLDALAEEDRVEHHPAAGLS
jgi:hypothetical protein